MFRFFSSPPRTSEIQGFFDPVRAISGSLSGRLSLRSSKLSSPCRPPKWDHPHFGLNPNIYSNSTPNYTFRLQTRPLYEYPGREETNCKILPLCWRFFLSCLCALSKTLFLSSTLPTYKTAPLYHSDDSSLLPATIVVFFRIILFQDNEGNGWHKLITLLVVIKRTKSWDTVDGDPDHKSLLDSLVVTSNQPVSSTTFVYYV